LIETRKHESDGTIRPLRYIMAEQFAENRTWRWCLLRDNLDENAAAFWSVKRRPVAK
jgi:hypothetical protein